jgi:glycosyltransferase involved in cell wall biosynthesis
MRIAIFSDNFYPELSGISDSVISLAKNLAARGHVVNFYVPHYAPGDYAAANVPAREIALGPNVRVTRFASFPYGSTGTGHARLVIPIGIRAAVVARFHPDVVHTQQFFGVGLEGLFAARVLKKPLVGTNHTATKEFLRYSPVRSALLDKIMLGYVNWYYERCIVVTAPSQSVFDEMVAFGFNATHAQVMPNPIDTKTFRPLADVDRAAAKKKFGFNNTTIIHAGRLSDERKPEVVLEALAIIKKTVPTAMLAFAGKGTSEKKLRARAAALRIEDAVKFLGFLDQPTLNEAYNASEVFAIASTSDTQSLVMMQAMASGLPIVGVRARGLPEYINDRNGFLVEPDNARAMAEKTIPLLADPAVAKKLGASARTYAEQFSGAAIAERWEKIYEKAIKDYNRGNTA